MKGLRTLGVLVLLLGGLAAYLYYVDSEKPVGETEEKPKVFTVEGRSDRGAQGLDHRRRRGRVEEVRRTAGP